MTHSDKNTAYASTPPAAELPIVGAEVDAVVPRSRANTGFVWDRVGVADAVAERPTGWLVLDGFASLTAMAWLGIAAALSSPLAGMVAFASAGVIAAELWHRRRRYRALRTLMAPLTGANGQGVQR